MGTRARAAERLPLAQLLRRLPGGGFAACRFLRAGVFGRGAGFGFSACVGFCAGFGAWVSV